VLLDEMVNGEPSQSNFTGSFTLYFVILEGRLQEFTWHYEEFVVEDEVHRG
jgi:hypothetical protein